MQDEDKKIVQVPCKDEDAPFDINDPPRVLSSEPWPTFLFEQPDSPQRILNLINIEINSNKRRDHREN